MIKNATNDRTKIIRTDRGGSSHRGSSKHTAPVTALFTKKLKLTHRTKKVLGSVRTELLERARSMAFASKAPAYLWLEAINAAKYLINRCPSGSYSDITPEEKYTGIRPSVNHLKTFGSLEYVHIPQQQRNKMQPKSNRCFFLC
uniref:Integrase catalytic domain-containing protein n=1 Tax=Physcomitrium patens TaxID=3218 RepID=A0A2K1ICZ4_PHYPA|nr:hypothetical protein PHYPA_030629 [Physcomitrium patens]